MTFPRKQFK